MYDSGSTADSSYAGSYEIFKAEGDVLFKQGNPKKALNSYNKALDLKPGDRTCLVARSQCYLQLGDSEAALIDAETTLQDDPENTKGLLQKAEALYCKGDFEYALVFYHRGNKLRPEVQAFRLGIQKSQEAIENCIGNEASIRLENKGDLSYFYKQDEKAPKKEERRVYKQAVVKKEERPVRRPRSHKDKKTVKQLLGELYADKDYLEQLLEETEGASNQSETNMTIRDLAIRGLEYLDTRTDFWQQQKPMYSRKRDGDMRDSRSRAGTAAGDPTAYILKVLEEIDEAQAQSKFEDSLKLSKKAMKTIDRWTEKDLPNRPEFVANIHSAMGNAYLEMGEYAKALEHHNVDREIATQQDIEECKSRALDNLGRVYARMGKFDKALEFWEEKLPMSKSALERTWLYHEIGRCYLEQGKYQTAHDNGEKSLAEAEEAGDDVWQLNASVLVAQAQMKLGDYQGALDYFEKSLEMAKVQNDKMAEKAIRHAIEDANRKIVKSIKSASSQDRDSKSAKSDKNSEKADEGEDDKKDEPVGDEEKKDAKKAEDEEAEEPSQKTDDEKKDSQEKSSDD